MYPFIESKTLIAVYKDELLVNQLRKLVETNDDEGQDTIVGTTDGSVKIVSWTEKFWLEQKKQGNLDAKVLFIGDIKGSDSLIPVVDIKFDKFGVKYGWAGSQAVIWIDTDELSDEDEYKDFLKRLRELPVPSQIKENLKKTSAITVANPKAKIWEHLAVLGANTAMFVKDAFNNRKQKRQQMLFYGIINLYNNDLETFMKL